MKAILIVILGFHIDGGAASVTVEFRSRQVCEAAKHAVVEDIKNRENHNWGRRNFIAVCVDA